MVAPPRTSAINGSARWATQCRLRVANPRWLTKSLLPRRQHNAKTRAAARAVLNLDGPAKAQDQMPRDGKTKPGAAANESCLDKKFSGGFIILGPAVRHLRESARRRKAALRAGEPLAVTGPADRELP